MILFFYLNSTTIATSDTQVWATSTATIVDVKELKHGLYEYTLIYPIPESRAQTIDKKWLTGHMTDTRTQHQKPKLFKTVCVKYMRDEPFIYEKLKDIKQCSLNEKSSQ